MSEYLLRGSGHFGYISAHGSRTYKSIVDARKKAYENALAYSQIFIYDISDGRNLISYVYYANGHRVCQSADRKRTWELRKDGKLGKEID